MQNTGKKINDCIDYKIGSLVKNKDGNFEILQDIGCYLYCAYKIQTSLILRDTDDKKCLTCGRLFESMKESEVWFVVDHLKFYCNLCGVADIVFIHFKDRKMPRLMIDVNKEVKEHPNYDDLTALKKLEISHFDNLNSKRSAYDNKTLRDVWLFLYHGISK